MNPFNKPRPTYPDDSLAYMLIHHGTIDVRLEDVNGWENLYPAERTFVYVYTLFVEVCNGGFKQFLWNSSGIHTRAILDSLKISSFAVTATMLEQAIRPFPRVFDFSDSDRRRFVVDSVETETIQLWEGLNDEYFKCNDYFCFYDILSEYVIANINEFPAARQFVKP